MSHSVHPLAKRRAASQHRGRSEVTHAQHKHIHTTKTGSCCWILAFIASDSCSEADGKQPFQFCCKPHPNTSITANSQAGISTERQRGKWAKKPNPPSPVPVSSLQEKLRHVRCGEERSREKQAFKCCTWKDMTTFVLNTGNVWVQCWQSGSDWMLSSSLRPDKQKKKNPNESSPKAVASNPWVKPS